MPVFIAELLEVLGPWLTRLAIAHFAGIVVKTLLAFGVGLFTYTEIVQPFIAQIESSMNGLPGNIAQWCGALGVDKAVSILIGAYTISAAKRIFFGKTTQ